MENLDEALVLGTVECCDDVRGEEFDLVRDWVRYVGAKRLSEAEISCIETAYRLSGEKGVAGLLVLAFGVGFPRRLIETEPMWARIPPNSHRRRHTYSGGTTFVRGEWRQVHKEVVEHLKQEFLEKMFRDEPEKPLFEFSLVPPDAQPPGKNTTGTGYGG